MFCCVGFFGEQFREKFRKKIKRENERDIGRERENEICDQLGRDN